MPITPRQAATRSTTLTESLVKAYEEIFDGQLAAEYAGSGRVIVQGSACPSIPMHVREKVRRELVRRYAAAGWSLEHKDAMPYEGGPWWEIRAKVQGNPRDGAYGYGSLDQAALDKHGR